MTALLHALANLARLRWLGATFCALAMLCVTTQASAFAGATAHARIDVNAGADIATTASTSELAQTKTRVGGFDQNSSLNTCANALVTLESHRGISPTQRETASASSNAARGGTPAPGEYLAGKAPKQVTPGTRSLEGQYVNDQGRVEPWTAHFDDYGRQVGRTDFNAGNKAQGIPDTHHHTYDWTNIHEAGKEVTSHVPGEYKPQ